MFFIQGIGVLISLSSQMHNFIRAYSIHARVKPNKKRHHISNYPGIPTIYAGPDCHRWNSQWHERVFRSTYHVCEWANQYRRRLYWSTKNGNWALFQREWVYLILRVSEIENIKILCNSFILINLLRVPSTVEDAQYYGILSVLWWNELALWSFLIILKVPLSL